MTKKLIASNAWVFPLLCWVLNALLILAKIDLGGTVNMLLALGQLAMLIAAIYIGAVVLINKQNNYSSKDKIHAMAGLVFVGLTFSLIVLAIVIG